MPMSNSQTAFEMSNPPDILKSIVRNKLNEVDSAKLVVPVSELRDRIDEAGGPRGFETRIRERLSIGESAVIAECKKASPSKGVIRHEYNVQEIASSYESGGAACLSVLTDKQYFQGALSDLTNARNSCLLPVLRKDFIVDAYQIFESRAAGADCILLIVAVLELEQIIDLGGLAQEMEMDVLVEVHSSGELETALESPHGMIGINNRNLHNFETSLETSINLCSQVPDDRIIVSESGIHTHEDVELLRNAGIGTYLVGESLMKATDPGSQLNKIFHFKQDGAK